MVMIIIDGSHHEGGGQIIRTAVALSALTGKAVKIEKIRAGRPNPGLRVQHLAAIEAVAKLSNAEVRGANIGSQTLEFIPKKINGGEISVKLATAGSIGLVLQALLIPAAFAEKPLKIRIEGGATFGKWAPPVLYLEKVVLPVLSRAGFSFRINILRNGFYPKGGALVEAETSPAKTGEFRLESRGALERIAGISVASNHLKNARVAERQKEVALKSLGNYEKTADIKTEYAESASPGSGIILWAECENTVLGADAAGELYLPAEKVGENAAKKLARELDSGKALDENMADQIVPYLALAGGSVGVSKITPHTETNIWVVEQFLDVKFEIDRTRNILKVLRVEKA